MADAKWSDNTAFPSQAHINPTDTIVGLKTSGAGGNVKYVTPIVQTTGSVTSGHILTYGSDGSIAKDSGVNIDANQNVFPNNAAAAFRTTATSGGTTTLTVSDAYNQFFTGTSTHTVVLPITSTLTTGFSFYIVNTSTMNITVQSSGGGTVQVMAPNSTVYVTCILTSGTTPASWYADAEGVGTDLFPNGTVIVTSSTQTIANGTVYVADAGGIVTFTLPTAVVGTFFAIVGINGWQLNVANGQNVTIGSTTAAGSSSQYWLSNNNSDTVIFECIGANIWQSVSISGTPITNGGILSRPAADLTTNSVSTSSKSMSVNNAYWCNNGASLITYTLPTTNLSFQSSSRIRVYGDSGQSSGGWKIVGGTGVVIRFANSASTATTGYLQSGSAGDWVELSFIQGNEWLVTNFGGNPQLDTGVAAFTAGENITISNGPGAITITATPSGDMFPNGTITVTSSTQTIANGTIYLAEAPGIVTFTLPSASYGSFFAIAGINGWQLNIPTSIVAVIGDIVVTGGAGVFWASTNVNDTIIWEWVGLNTIQAFSCVGFPVTNLGVTPRISSWIDQTTSAVSMAGNTGYTSDDGATLVTFNLPTTASIGTFVEVVGKGSGGWTIAQAAGQQIHFGNQTTTSGTGGSLSSTNQYDCVRLRNITANTIWTVVSSQGNLTVV